MSRPCTLPSRRHAITSPSTGRLWPPSSPTRPWLLLCLLSLLLVVGLRAAGAVEGLTLKSLAPGKLQIEWQAPASGPTDYRVSWAPVGQEFPSYREDFGNAYPTEPALTLQDLQPGVEYQVIVRARYGADHPRGFSADPFSDAVVQRIDEHGSDSDGAGTVEVDEPLDGWIDSTGDVDWLGLEVQADSSYYVELEAPGRFNALLFGVYDDEGEAVHDGVTWSGASALLFTPTSDGMFYLSVAGLDDETGDYTVAVEDEEPEGMITGLRLARDPSGDLTVSWDTASPGATDYRLRWAEVDENFPSWRDDAGNAYPTGTSHAITGLDAEAAYKVEVRARYHDGVHADDRWSGPWALAFPSAASVRTVDDDSANTKTDDDKPLLKRQDDDALVPRQESAAPAKPTGLRVRQLVDEGMLSLRLQWDDPEGDSITRYDIFRGASTDTLTYYDQVSVSAGAVVTEYVDEFVEFGTPYAYAIQAVNLTSAMVFSSDQSDPVSLTTQSRQPPPHRPLRAYAEATNTQVTLSWIRNSNNFYVEGYRIERGENASPSEILVDFVRADYLFHPPGGGSPQVYVDTDVLPGVDYHYRVRAINEWGMSRYGAPARATTASAVPPGLRAVATRNTVTLSWDDPEDDTITGYRILRSVGGGPERVHVNRLGSGASSYVDRNLTSETAYAYRMQALRAGAGGVKTRFVSMLTLPAAAPASGPAPGSEPAGQDLSGSTATGRLDSPGDQDWFALDLVAGETYFIQARGRGIDEPLPGAAILCAGTTSAGGTWSSGSADCWDRVDVPHYLARTTGRYYVSVSSNSRIRAVGDYEIELRRDVAADVSTTARVDAGEWVSGELLDPDPGDWYRAKLCRDHTYRVHQYFHQDTGTGPDGYSGTPQVSLYDKRGTYLNLSYANHTTPPFVVKAPKSDTYFVGIDSSSRLGPGPYEFRLDKVGLPDDLDDLAAVSEPAGGDLSADDTTTGLLPFDQTVTGEVASAADRDWFRVRFDERLCEHVYWFELKGADTSDGTLADPFIAGIYDGDGELIPYSWTAGQMETRDFNSGDGNNAIVDFTPHLTGDFYVEVGGENGATGTYTLSLTNVHDTSTSERGDMDFFSWEGAVNASGDRLAGYLAPGKPATGEAGTGADNQGDAFRLQIELDRYYRVEAKGQETGHGTINSPALHLTAIYSFPSDSSLTSGDYVVSFAEGYYTEYDYLEERYLEVPIANPSFEFKATEEYPGVPEPPAVWNAALYGGPGTYTVLLTDITDSDDDYRGSRHTNGRIAVGGSVSGTLDVDGDVDWFRTRLQAGKSYRIRMRGAEFGGGTLADPHLRLIQGDRLTYTNQEAQNDDKSMTEKDSEIVYDATVTALYMIEAATPGTGTGTYTISLEEVSN